MKLHYTVEVRCRAMNELSLYQRLRDAIFEWQRGEPRVASVEVLPVPRQRVGIIDDRPLKEIRAQEFLRRGTIDKKLVRCKPLKAGEIL